MKEDAVTRVFKNNMDEDIIVKFDHTIYPKIHREFRIIFSEDLYLCGWGLETEKTVHVKIGDTRIYENLFEGTDSSEATKLLCGKIHDDVHGFKLKSSEHLNVHQQSYEMRNGESIYGIPLTAIMDYLPNYDDKDTYCLPEYMAWLLTQLLWASNGGRVGELVYVDKSKTSDRCWKVFRYDFNEANPVAFFDNIPTAIDYANQLLSEFEGSCVYPNSDSVEHIQRKNIVYRKTLFNKKTGWNDG